MTLVCWHQIDHITILISAPSAQGKNCSYLRYGGIATQELP